MKLVLASQNQGKLLEVQALLRPLDIELHTIAEYPETAGLDVAETAPDFQGNALLKAEAYGGRLKLPVLADDSGLEVDALDGQPGVASNRWFPGSDHDRNQALLDRLANQTNRLARFVTVLCLLEPNQPPRFFRGEVVGSLAYEPIGDDGFGYDPIFIPKGCTRSFAEMGITLKNTLSHRARALEQLLGYLQKR